MYSSIRRNLHLAIIIAVALTAAMPGRASAESKAALIEDLLDAYHEYGQFNGAALIAEGGEIVHKAGYGLADMEWSIPNRSDTKFRIGSVTKQFTSMLIMQLVQDGSLRLEGSLSEYLPYYREDTIRRTLQKFHRDERIGLRANEYAMMLRFFSEKRVRDWQNRRIKMDEMFDDAAMIYQVHDNVQGQGMELFTKWEFIDKMTMPAQSLKGIDVLDTKYVGDKIMVLRFRVLIKN